MRSLDILAVGIRLLGLFFIFKILQNAQVLFAQYLFATSANQDFPIVYWITYGSLAMIMLVFVGLCIKFPVTISKVILPKTKQESPVFNGSMGDLQIVGFILLGVYILSWAIPDFIYNSLFLLSSDVGEVGFGYSDLLTYKVNIAVTLIEISIAIYLIFQAKGLSNIIKRIRS